MDAAKQYVKENKLTTVGGLWAIGIGASMAYQWKGSGSTSVKVIHSRIYAQALTLSALVASASVEYYDRFYDPPPPKWVDPHSYEATHTYAAKK
mmetsp:Transcript_42913/g.71549  ORF Transcript_42913/g.71549 Transcript_42913/m.71549 type:complete len:94 (-) Transcript_42913:225-506(-)|eukprot:CAMPEP_0198211256 /NCGR_PEP_ID=MMETSP1445-20131203/22890_1 /TAXON_ID=36898 /ORGANISM="Pyramimonas sp., Strain CCMP2087" /LENGTH=93 /DNA_ID=CAMNT_0043885475 /DNA_START=110 /DNA_END=391 /DNA_ORIENTATION=+